MDEKPKRGKRKKHHEENAEGCEMEFEGEGRPLLEAEGSAKKRKGALKKAEIEPEEQSQVAWEQSPDGEHFAPPGYNRSDKAGRSGKQETQEEKPRVRKGPDAAAPKGGIFVRRMGSAEEKTGEVVLLSEQAATKRKHGAEDGPGGSQKKASKRKADLPEKDRAAREGSPEPSFHGRTLRVASPPRRKWQGDGDAKAGKVAPTSPTRAAAKRAAAESADGRKERVRVGPEGTGGADRQEAEREVVEAIAEILGAQDDPAAAVPMNKLFMQVGVRSFCFFNFQWKRKEGEKQDSAHPACGAYGSLDCEPEVMFVGGNGEDTFCLKSVPHSDMIGLVA